MDKIKELEKGIKNAEEQVYVENAQLELFYVIAKTNIEILKKLSNK